MKQSLRAKRMARHHGRHKKKSDLNLTSLMDIFTILVFFLMVNSSNVQVLKNTKTITMPVSSADQEPKETLVLQVDANQIVTGGRKIADILDVIDSSEDIIASLEAELKYLASTRPEMTAEEKNLGRAITIQGDQKIPYKVFKRIMATCAATDYRDISLAVSRQDKKSNGQGES